VPLAALIAILAGCGLMAPPETAVPSLDARSVASNVIFEVVP
jgi:hypothetical protein